jgi:hypothetical protein
MARRKKNKIVEKPKIPEYEGFKLGDIIWFVRVDGKIRKGRILDFYPSNETEPALSVMDALEGRYQVSPVRCCSFDKSSLKNKSWNCKKT